MWTLEGGVPAPPSLGAHMSDPASTGAYEYALGRAQRGTSTVEDAPITHRNRTRICMATTHLLARAVIRRNDRVLVVRATGQAHTFLPGGHVEDGEGLRDCLRRELREELGVASEVGAYRGVVEHRWRRDGTPQYELNHCFAVTAPALPDAAPTAEEGYLSFEWVPADALGTVHLQPAPLRRLLDPEEDASVPWWASTLTEPAEAE